jgi:phage-related minor tail protein
MALRTVSSWMKMMTSRVGGIVLVSRNIPDNIILDFTITSWLTIDTMPK